MKLGAAELGDERKLAGDAVENVVAVDIGKNIGRDYPGIHSLEIEDIAYGLDRPAAGDRQDPEALLAIENCCKIGRITHRLAVDRIGDDRHEPGIVTGRPRLTAAGILGIGRERKSACKQNRSARDPQGVTHTVPSRVNVPNPPQRPATRRWASTVNQKPRTAPECGNRQARIWNL